MKYILFLILAINMPQQDIENTIRALNKQMEDAFNSGDLQGVADFYHDDAHLLSPGDGHVSGRKNIDNYWTRLENTVDWQLDVIAVSDNEEDIYENDYWLALKNKPPAWRVQGIDIDDDGDLIYQLGHSSLTLMKDGKTHTSEVDFLLVWKHTPDGYKIILDTYTWQ